ncbi:beta-lactamase/transpeptidase-like protein [Fusarium tricinctum]|uniref:Beta-lactamase/transpeptidase-like protein n=1 Tax=Fusarium tricinctum TaxID=61284 RepID=A0A8K0S2V1_9HYPO|nr:beta-lactamase/transpeptidase-like protein [Fusarium tricinctum]
MAWKTPLSHYIPEFKHPDPAVREKANLIDFLRHSTGLSSPQLLILGPRGTLIHPEKDFVQLMNTSPSCDENGSRHNRWWSYDNWGYGLVAVALERVYQRHYEDILRQKFLSPLNLSRTVVDSSELSQDSNIAYPYVVLDNGTFHRSTSDKWTYQNHRPANAALGMRSCVRDMLSWALCVLESEKESKKEEAISITKKGTYGHSQRLSDPKGTMDKAVAGQEPHQ